MVEGSLEVKFPTIWTDEKQRWEESEKRREEKKEYQKRESLRRKKIQVREKVGKARNTAFFQWFVVPEGRKSRLARAAGAEPAGQMRDEHLHAFVARTTFLNSKWTKHLSSGALLEVAMSKKCTALWREAHFELKSVKTAGFGALLEVEMFKRCTPLWRKAHVEVNMHKTPHVRATFGRWSVVLRGRRKGLCTLSKVSTTWGFCFISKNDGRRGTFEEDLQRCIFRGKRSTRDMFIRPVRRSGRWFPESSCILEHQIFSFGKMILRDRCSTPYDLAWLLHDFFAAGAVL